MKSWVAIAGLAAVFASTGAAAQTAPISRTVQVTFSGIVSSTAADTMLVRQPDGSLATFQGQLPPLPYAQGDPITISFNATLPTRAFYDSGAYQGQTAADGIYRIRVANPYYTGGTTAGGIGSSTSADVSGPINPALNSGQPTNSLMTIVYDYNTDSYSIEGGGDFLSSAYSSPGYIYDAASQTYIACSSGVTCSTSGPDPILTGLRAGPGNSATTIQSGNIAVQSTDLTSGTGTGFFSWLFSGSWNLPQFGGGGGTAEVPEPGMLGLFGGAVAFLALRRRRGKAAAKAS
jgi:hypothetical protein